MDLAIGPSQPLSDMDSQDCSLSDATSIIRTIDTASYEAHVSVVTASKEVEEAKRNARAAAELAQHFMAMASSSTASRLPQDARNRPYFDFRSGSPQGSPSKKQYQPPSPLSKRNGLSLDMSKSLQRGPALAGPVNPLSSTDHMARVNSDAVVSLTLQLDRAKHHLEVEQMTHEETRCLLNQATARNSQLEAQIENLLNDMETQREYFGRTIDSLEQNVAQARSRVAAAEEDAQLALDLANKNNECRVEVERCLELTLKKSEKLTMELESKTLFLESQTPPKQNRASQPTASSIPSYRGPSVPPTAKFVRFADSPTVYSDPAPNDHGTTPKRILPHTPSDTGIMTGRRLMERVLVENSPASAAFSFPLREEASESHASKYRYKATLERSQILQGQLKGTAFKGDSTVPLASSVAATESDAIKMMSPAINVLQNVSNILTESGRRMGLTGRWCTDTSVRQGDGNDIAQNLEPMARHYTASMESLVNQKHKQLVELESLCTLWETGRDEVPTL